MSVTGNVVRRRVTHKSLDTKKVLDYIGIRIKTIVICTSKMISRNDVGVNVILNTFIVLGVPDIQRDFSNVDVKTTHFISLRNPNIPEILPIVGVIITLYWNF